MTFLETPELGFPVTYERALDRLESLRGVEGSGQVRLSNSSDLVSHLKYALGCSPRGDLFLPPLRSDA